MQNLAKIGLSTMEGDSMPSIEEGPKRQVNVYFTEDTHNELYDLSNERKKADRTYSVTRLVNEAVTLYLMALRFHKESRSPQSLYDFVLGALKTFRDSERSRK